MLAPLPSARRGDIGGDDGLPSTVSDTVWTGSSCGDPIGSPFSWDGTASDTSGSMLCATPSETGTTGPGWGWYGVSCMTWETV